MNAPEIYTAISKLDDRNKVPAPLIVAYNELPDDVRKGLAAALLQDFQITIAGTVVEEAKAAHVAVAELESLPTP